MPKVNGTPRSWRDGDEMFYPVAEGRCEECKELFKAGQIVQERPLMSRRLYHHDKVNCYTNPDMPYGGAPFVAGSETSEEAAALIGPKAETLRMQVLKFLIDQGDDGATDEEIQDATGMGSNTERPRRRELEEANLVLKTYRIRRNRSKRRAAVYVATERGRAWAARLEQNAS